MIKRRHLFRKMNTEDNFDALSERKKLFCRSYVENGGNGQKAAIDAGYKESDAKSRASKLLKLEDVLDYILFLSKSAEGDSVASISEIQSFWTSIMRADIDCGEDGNVKLNDRINASNLLAKSKGMFLDKVELSGKDGVLPTINLNFVTPEK